MGCSLRPAGLASTPPPRRSETHCGCECEARFGNGKEARGTQESGRLRVNRGMKRAFHRASCSGAPTVAF